MKVKTSYENVKKLLTEYKSLRDNDAKLMANYWGLEMVKMNIDPDKTPTRDFLKMLGEGRFSKMESVTRARRKLQEKYPELRGETYNQRQGVEQEETKQEMRDLRHGD